MQTSGEPSGRGLVGSGIREENCPFQGSQEVVVFLSGAGFMFSQVTNVIGMELNLYRFHNDSWPEYRCFVVGYDGPGLCCVLLWWTSQDVRGGCVGDIL
jgi:hypothetical protein